MTPEDSREQDNAAEGEVITAVAGRGALGTQVAKVVDAAVCLVIAAIPEDGLPVVGRISGHVVPGSAADPGPDPCLPVPAADAAAGAGVLERAAAPKLAMALGYDTEGALEHQSRRWRQLSAEQADCHRLSHRVIA